MKTLWDKNSFSGKLLSLVFPIAFQHFMAAAVSASDALMLGFISQDSMSAVSLAGQVMFIYTLFLWALTGGASIFAAQYWGKRDTDSVEKILGITLKLSVIISAVFSAAAIAVPRLLMRAFTNEASLIGPGAEYLRVVGISYLIMGISQIYLCIMKNCGKAAKSAVISAVSMLLNILFNTFLIFGIGIFPKMGAEGAALATVISKVIEFVWTLSQLRKKDSIKIRRNYLFHADKILMNDFCKYTAPVLGNQLVWGCGFAMYSVIMGHLGSDAVAANSIANIVKDMIICFCAGIGNGGGIMVGNELGSGNLQRAKEYGSKICRTALIAGIISGLCILALTPLILKFTKLTEQSQEYLKVMLIVCSYYVVGKSMNMATIAGIFCSGGDSKFGFICDAVTMWAVVVPIGLISAFVLKLPVTVVYILMNIDELIKLPVVYKNYKKYRWLKDLTRDNPQNTTC